MNKLVLSILILGNSIIASSQQGINVHSTPKKAARITSIGGRWYNYADSFFALAYVGEPCTPVNDVRSIRIPLWYDTTATFVYMDTVTYQTNKTTSIGMGCIPFASWWNTASYFAGEIAVTTSDDYYVDSVIALGSYGRNPAKPTIVDSLIFATVYGNGGTTVGDLPKFYFNGMTDYCVDTLKWLQLFHDSIHNCGANSQYGTTTTTSRHYEAYPLFAADSGGIFNKAFALSPSTGGYHVPAGNAFAVSVTFKSGDPAYPATGAIPRDTIKRIDGTYKYGAFMPEVVYTHGMTLYDYGFYKNESDLTTGYYKIAGLTTGFGPNEYIPNTLWTATTTYDKYQYPGMIFHVSCPTCRPIPTWILGANTVVSPNTINIYPNPADDVLNVDMGNGGGNIIVTLTNIIGEVVATQSLQSAGHTTINTGNLSPGIYIYNVSGGGNNTSGKIYISH